MMNVVWLIVILILFGMLWSVHRAFVELDREWRVYDYWRKQRMRPASVTLLDEFEWANLLYKVVYTDRDGGVHEAVCKIGRFWYDGVYVREPKLVVTSVKWSGTSSKEQIISDLDAEIKRLRLALATNAE